MRCHNYKKYAVSIKAGRAMKRKDAPMMPDETADVNEFLRLLEKGTLIIDKERTRILETME